MLLNLPYLIFFCRLAADFNIDISKISLEMHRVTSSVKESQRALALPLLPNRLDGCRSLDLKIADVARSTLGKTRLELINCHPKRNGITAGFRTKHERFLHDGPWHYAAKLYLSLFPRKSAAENT